MQTSDSGDERDQNSMKKVSRLPRKSTMCLRPKIVSALKPLAGVNASIAHWSQGLLNCLMFAAMKR